MNTLAIAQSEDEAQTSTGSVDFIISTDQDASAEALASLDALRSSLGIELVDQSCKFGFELWRAEDMPSDADWAAALTDPLCIQALEAIEYIQPNYTLTAADFSTTSISTDPMSDRQWALDNTGQTGGQTDADIDAPEAWTQATGEGVIVAVIDTGVDYTHADLDDNMWVNTGEIAGNGIDDDGNGYIDDVYGYDFANDDGDPLDSQGHGTHVAGTIAAEADNGIGVVGVAYDAQIMALQFFDDNGNGSTFDAILALEYAVLMGAQISNNSWGGGSYSTALAEAIAMAGDAGHLFVAAAGNDALNNDAFPHYPSSYDLDNLIAVAATDHNDDLAFFSNYGTVSVDVAAPGQNILSTVDGGGYAYYSGTSMAAPHVAAIAALMLEQNPTMSPLQIRDRLIETSDIRSDLANSTVSGGRVNAGEAVAWQGPGSITGTVWNDVDRDGLRDPAEIGLAGRRVYIDANQNGQRDEGERTAITNASGVYSFTDLTPGRYMIAQELPSGSDQTSPLAPTDYSWHDNRSGEIGFSWVDISQSGKTLSLRDDDSALVSLPFAFEFYGEVQDELRISSNGYLTFGNSGSAYMNGRLGQADGTDGIIAPFWDDLNPARGGRIYYGLDDKGEKFVVTYENVQPFSGSSSYTFQVIMDQSGAITFQYLEMTGTVNRATIGIEDTSGTSGLELAYNSTFVENGLAVQMAPVATRQIGIEVQVDAGQTTSGVNFGATVGAPVVAEFGYLFAVTEQAQTVVLDNIFENPVVFAFAQSHDNADPFITRISDVQNGQFTLRLQEPDYADNVTSQIAVAYVVMEEGAWELPNGAILEVGSFTASANAPWSWDNVSFDAAFEDTPAVFGQTQTENDSSFVQARVSSVDADGFRVALQEEEAEKFNTHADEDVGWFAISESTGIWGDMRYEASLFEARETEASYEFDNAYTGAPVVFADMMSSWGIDPSWAQAGQVTEDSVTLYTQEETSTDQELVHATETFGVLAIAGTGQATATAWEAGVISGRLWNDADGDQSVSSREGGLSGWTVYLDANNNGQRDSGEVTSQSDMYGHYRFAGLSADTYTVRVDAPSGWDATTSATQTLSLSAEEDATYVDFGLQSPDRTIMEFGSLEALTHVAQTIELNGSFENPVVIAQITSLNENEFCAVRISDVTSDSFTLRLQEGDYLDGIHAAESISYVVVEAGRWQLPDGTVFEAGTLDSGKLTWDGFENVTLSGDLETGPAVLTQVQTENDSAFVKSRTRNIDETGFQIALEEEEIANDGSHGVETIGWLAIETGSGDWDGHAFQATRTDAAYKHWNHSLDFEQSFGDTPNLMLDISSYNGIDPSVMQVMDLDADGFDFRVMEDTSREEEIGHAMEEISILAIEGTGVLTGSAEQPDFMGYAGGPLWSDGDSWLGSLLANSASEAADALL